MSLNGPRLATALKADIYTQLQTVFPMPPDLLPPEQEAYAVYQQKLANAIGDGAGPDVVTEITGNAVVPFPIAGTVLSGAGAGGNTATTAPGTVT